MNQIDEHDGDPANVAPEDFVKQLGLLHQHQKSVVSSGRKESVRNSRRRSSFIQDQNRFKQISSVSRMPLKDKLSLGPLEKYTIYNRFPYKFILHILLVVTMSLTILVQVQPNQNVMRNQHLVWYQKFMWNQEGDDSVPVMDDFERERRFFTTKDLKDFVKQSLTNYYEMFEDGNDEFQIYEKNSLVEMFTIFVDDSQATLENKQEIGPADADGNFDTIFKTQTASETQKWVQNMREFQLRYNKIHIEYPMQYKYRNERDVTCFSWDINQRFYHLESPQIMVTLDLSPNTCVQYKNLSDYWWLNVITVILSLASFIFELQHILDRLGTMNKLRQAFRKSKKAEEAKKQVTAYTHSTSVNSIDMDDTLRQSEMPLIDRQNKLQSLNQKDLKSKAGIFDRSLTYMAGVFTGQNRNRSVDQSRAGGGPNNDDANKTLQSRKEQLLRESNWNDLMFTDKLRLVDVWSIISIIANISQVVGSLYAINRNTLNLVTSDRALGIGTMLAWFVLLRYLLKTQNYSVMLMSFSKAGPFVFRALVSVIPLFIGFAFLGMALFWESRRFGNFETSCFTLFALMHGDMIWDTYNDILQINALYTYIYLYSYIFVSICVIANLFTIIIEEGFMKQKYDNDYTWLLQHTRKHLGLDEQQTNEDSNMQSGEQNEKEGGADAGGGGDAQDGINVDSDVIVSEFRLLYLRYQEQIKLYKEAIANLSLKQIINNEEEAWIFYKEKLLEQKNQKKVQQQVGYSQRNSIKVREDQYADLFKSQMQEIIDPRIRQQNRRIISAMTTSEFDEEIESLTQQLNEKIITLRKDYRDLKIFQNKEDIEAARSKLIIFVKKLIDDTTKLIRQIGVDFEKNRNKLENGGNQDTGTKETTGQRQQFDVYDENDDVLADQRVTTVMVKDSDSVQPGQEINFLNTGSAFAVDTGNTGSVTDQNQLDNYQSVVNRITTTGKNEESD